MELEKLIKKFNICDEIYVSKNTLNHIIVKYIKEGKVEEVSKRWNEDFKNKNINFYPLDLSDSGNWSTYEDCTELKLKMIDGKISCIATIYRGYNMDGRRMEKKFTCGLVLPIEFIFELEYYINSKYKRYLNNLYEEHLETQRELWIEKTNIELLK